jgi:hypothetical protein
MTFAEFRAMMDKMKTVMARMKPQTEEKPAEKDEWKFDVKVDKTGERQTINGYSCEKVIVTLKAVGEMKPDAAKGETGGQGGMMVTSTQWMTPKVDGWEEALAFWKTFAEKSGFTSGSGPGASVESLMGSNPQLAAAFKRLMEEGQKLNGVAVKTESVFESWGQPAAPQGMEEQPKEEKPPSSMGGLLGGLGRKMAKKPESGGTSESDRKPVFESSSTLESVSSASLDAGLFAAPANYKNKPMKK